MNPIALFNKGSSEAYLVFLQDLKRSQFVSVFKVKFTTSNCFTSLSIVKFLNPVTDTMKELISINFYREKIKN